MNEKKTNNKSTCIKMKKNNNKTKNLFLLSIFIILGLLTQGTEGNDVEKRDTYIDCLPESETTYKCTDGVTYTISAHSNDLYSFILYMSITGGLVAVVGITSGLTLGLLSLDITMLKIMTVSGSEKEKKYANIIIPVIRRHHLLLVTLILPYVAAMETLPVVLHKMVPAEFAVLISVTFVLFFGEIIPQAICSRFRLQIGAMTVPIVKLLIVILFIISWPIAQLLDSLLGTTHLTFYRRSQLRELVRMHEDQLTPDESKIIIGALDMIDKTAEMTMTSVADVFMIDVNAQLDQETFEMLKECGHSRVPVYDGHRENIVGVLLTKTLICMEPAEESLPVSDARLNRLPEVSNRTPLYEVLHHFKTERTNISAVKDDVSKEIIGIITLEDVIEELIQEEIVDETDVFVDNKREQLANLLRRMSTDISRSARSRLSVDAIRREEVRVSMEGGRRGSGQNNSYFKV